MRSTEENIRVLNADLAIKGRDQRTIFQHGAQLPATRTITRNVAYPAFDVNLVCFEDSDTMNNGPSMRPIAFSIPVAKDQRTPTRVNITFHVDTEGQLSVTAMNLPSGRAKQVDYFGRDAALRLATTAGEEQASKRLRAPVERKLTQDDIDLLRTWGEDD
jgi:hypothetical protein